MKTLACCDVQESSSQKTESWHLIGPNSPYWIVNAQNVKCKNECMDQSDAGLSVFCLHNRNKFKYGGIQNHKWRSKFEIDTNHKLSLLKYLKKSLSGKFKLWCKLILSIKNRFPWVISSLVQCDFYCELFPETEFFTNLKQLTENQFFKTIYHIPVRLEWELHLLIEKVRFNFRKWISYT